MTHLSKNRADILQERFALKTTSYLSASTADLPHDVTERLRAARTQAVAQRKVAKTQATFIAAHSGGAALTWGTNASIWWPRIGSALLLVTLVVGLLTISSVQDDNRTQEIAEVDAALLIDELPPAAFADPGFVQFLKTTR